MTTKKRKLSITQILTIAFIVLCLVWERNVQIYLGEHGLENNFQTRKDLLVSIPILIILIVISIRQWKKTKRA